MKRGSPRPPGGRLRLQLALISVVILSTGLFFSGRFSWSEAWPLTSHPSSSPQEKQQLRNLLAQARTIDNRTTILGYSRDQFGHGWALGQAEDKTWCNTRVNVLKEQLAEHEGTQCTIIRGKGLDPYTGKMISVDETDIDHLVPLAAAWDLGAAWWTPSQRITFANDRKRNLVITESAVNREKSDFTPGEWIPPDPHQHCWYARAYLAVIVAYNLAITQSDRTQLSSMCR